MSDNGVMQQRARLVCSKILLVTKYCLFSSTEIVLKKYFKGLNLKKKCFSVASEQSLNSFVNSLVRTILKINVNGI